MKQQTPPSCSLAPAGPVRLTLCALLALAMGCAGASTTTGARDPVQGPRFHPRLAEAAWGKRADRDELRTALSEWELARGKSPTDLALLSQLTRGYFFLGEHLYNDGAVEDASAALEKAVQAGEHGLMASSHTFAAEVKAGGKVADFLHHIPPTGQGLLYWYGVSLGRFASLSGLRTMLFYQTRLFAVMTRVLEIDENYFHGAPHRYFGAYFAQAPAFAGGDLSKARNHFDRALQIEPDFFGTKVAYAEYFATKSNDPALFKRLLNEVISGDPTVLPGVEPEQVLSQRRARALLKDEKRLF